MAQQSSSPVPNPTPPSENTIEVNVTHEILEEGNESSLSAMTAVSPSRTDEGDEFNYDMLPDPRPGPSGYRQTAVAIQFKALNSEDGTYELGTINGGNSGKYLKLDIDTSQLEDIRDSNEGRTYQYGELFYAIPLPASRLAFPEYLQWTVFIDAFDLPKKCSILYIPVCYSPGACTEHVTADEIMKVADHHRDLLGAFGRKLGALVSGNNRWLEQGIKSEFDDWESLDDFMKNVYDVIRPNPEKYGGPDSYPDISGLDSDSAMPRKYGIFARRKDTGEAEPVMEHVRSWNEIQDGLGHHPTYGRRLPRHPLSSDGGDEPVEVDPLIPPEGWNLFIHTSLPEDAG